MLSAEKKLRREERDVQAERQRVEKLVSRLEKDHLRLRDQLEKMSMELEEKDERRKQLDLELADRTAKQRQDDLEEWDRREHRFKNSEKERLEAEDRMLRKLDLLSERIDRSNARAQSGEAGSADPAFALDKADLIDLEGKMARNIGQVANELDMLRAKVDKLHEPGASHSGTKAVDVGKVEELIDMKLGNRKLESVISDKVKEEMRKDEQKRQDDFAAERARMDSAIADQAEDNRQVFDRMKEKLTSLGRKIEGVEDYVHTHVLDRLSAMEKLTGVGKIGSEFVDKLKNLEKNLKSDASDRIGELESEVESQLAKLKDMVSEGQAYKKDIDAINQELDKLLTGVNHIKEQGDDYAQTLRQQVERQTSINSSYSKALEDLREQAVSADALDNFKGEVMVKLRALEMATSSTVEANKAAISAAIAAFPAAQLTGTTSTKSLTSESAYTSTTFESTRASAESGKSPPAKSEKSKSIPHKTKPPPPEKAKPVKSPSPAKSEKAKSPGKAKSPSKAKSPGKAASTFTSPAKEEDDSMLDLLSDDDSSKEEAKGSSPSGKSRKGEKSPAYDPVAVSRSRRASLETDDRAIPASSKDRAEMSVDKFVSIVEKGHTFVRYPVGRGKPKKKDVYFLKSQAKLFWCEENGTRDPTVDRSLSLDEITDLYVGKSTAAFEKKAGQKAIENFCFSIGASRGTLDLEADSKETRDVWVTALQVIAQQPVRVHHPEGVELALASSEKVGKQEAPVAEENTEDQEVGEDVESSEDVQIANITVQCRDLIRLNESRETAPLVVLFEYDPEKQQLVYVDQTEWREDTTNPDFDKPVTLEYTAESGPSKQMR